MCGRYSLHGDWKQSLTPSEIKEKVESFEPKPDNYNVTPLSIMPVIYQSDQKIHIEPMIWGFIPVWAKDPSMASKMINARSETLHEKPSFKHALKRRRCMVPMSGFFEWAHSSKGKKQPVYMSMPHSNPFFAAGLWEEWTDKETFSTLRSFTILTVPANAKIAAYHERMPAILEEVDMLFWLGSESKASAALRTCPEHLLISKFVSLDVNNPKMNSASLLEEVQSDIHIENLIPTIPPGKKKLLLKNINENKQSTLF